MKSANCLIMLILALFVINGCGPGSSDISSETAAVIDTSTIDWGSANMRLSAPNLSTGTLVSHGGQTTIRAYLSYTRTNTDDTKEVIPVEDGTVVNFYVISSSGSSKYDTINDAGSIEATKSTVNGYAEATYTADLYGGTVKIFTETDPNYSGTSGSTNTGLGYLEDTFSFEVATGDPVAISVASVSPDTIGVLGSARAQTSAITAYSSIISFNVRDGANNPVPDGSLVSFSITTTLGGGEKLSISEADTKNGIVYVSLISGTVSGTVGVNASYYDVDESVSIATEAKVTIVSGLPSADHLGMAVQFHNIAGGRTLGLHDEITAYLGDRYGNVPPDGTTVSFMTEGGTVGTSAGFTSTTNFGVASGTLQSSLPTTPDLGGVVGSTQGNFGLCRVVAYTPGDEGFNDINGNNVYDEGTDVLTLDMSEPYIDANDNGAYDSQEKYIDSDGSGTFTPADGIYQSNKLIWVSQNVLFSDAMASLNFQPTIFSVVPLATQVFTFQLGDVWGNSLVGGTQVTVTSSDGKVTGQANFTIGDGVGLTETYTFQVTFSEEPELPVEVKVEVTPNSGDAGANSGVIIMASAIGA